MLGLAVRTIRAAGSLVALAAGIVLAVVALGIIERAGTGAAPLLHRSWLLGLAARAALVALLVALTLGAPTVRFPLLNLLLATSAMLALLATAATEADAPAHAAFVAPHGAIFRTVAGGQGLILTDTLGTLRVGETLAPVATLWIPVPSSPIVPSEQLRYREARLGLSEPSGLHSSDGEVLVPAQRLFAPPDDAIGNSLTHLPGAAAWQAGTIVRDLLELATAPTRQPTFNARLIVLAAICFFFFSLRVLLRLTHWLAANLLITLVGLRLGVGLILAISPQVIPDLLGLLPAWAAERLTDHALAVAVIIVGVPMLVLDLLFSPLPGRSLSQLRRPAAAAS